MKRDRHARGNFYMTERGHARGNFYKLPCRKIPPYTIYVFAREVYYES
jgi:hypothetical protein